MKIICVGLNYDSHKEEMKEMQVVSDTNPVLFMKPDTAILPSDKHQFYIPDFSKNIHYEAEVVVRIDKIGKNIAERFAHRYYSQLTLGLDLTARDLQQELKAKGLPWEISKAFDCSAVVGEFISKDKLTTGVDDLNYYLIKNDRKVQGTSTSELIHSIDQIIAYASRFFSLKIGDLIFTGTPAGVGRVDIGDKLQGYLDGRQVFNIEVC